MSLPVGTVPTDRDIFSYGMSLCSYTCPYRKGHTFGPKINACFPFGAGLGAISSRVRSLAANVASLAEHNYKVHSQRYCQLLQHLGKMM